MSEQLVISWFEIPATDINRAAAWYGKIFDYELSPFDMQGQIMAFFPMSEGTTGGALIQSSEHEPSMQGSLVYLNAGDRMDTLLERIAESEGEVLMPRTSIGEHGFIAMFKDTEGNRVALHSPA
ncbi:VOC family protein [Acanthopleuribacter pedis]|uniref:VOC family protein n=1 Tax=Acanthopleuribacter pedis TaxID=442870 RepID=A0A8J7U4K9_9BACT|nr:VOC family protein [Acanthopleuribacter pedis]MBO1320747.1 VOC family protein [Acanthopleuribacter pedis]